MKKNQHYQYYVEGQCEKKLITVLKEKQLVCPGKIDVFNPIQNCLTELHIRPLAPNTIVVLVFDTDKKETDVLVQNIAFLKAQPNVDKVICIPQNKNMEGEILRCTDIKKVKDLLPSKTVKEFKNDFIKEKRLYEKLIDHKFDISLLWSTVPPKEFADIGIINQGKEIKRKPKP